MITSVINHHTRKKMGLTCSQYLVLDAVMQMGYTEAELISGALGINISAIDGIVEVLLQSDMIKSDGKTLFISDSTRKQMTGQEEIKPRQRKKKDGEISEVATKVIQVFNAVNGTRYEAGTYGKLIDTIIQEKKINPTQFESVIRHKHLTWGADEKMKEYNRPATIFRSTNKFMQYLDDARVYWAERAKENFDYSEVGR